MTSSREDRDFGSEMSSHLDFSGLLPDAITWIQDNMTPDQVFNQDVLNDWAEANDFVKKE